MTSRSYAGSERRFRQIRPARRHSSRHRAQREYSQPDGSAGGIVNPRRSARHEHRHHGMSSTTAVSASSSRRSSVSWQLPSAIHSSPASATRCVSRHSVSDGATQPGCQKWRSRWMSGKPVRAASSAASVLLPEPARPVMTTRRPTVNRVSLTHSVSPSPVPVPARVEGGRNTRYDVRHRTASVPDRRLDGGRRACTRTSA